MQFATDSFPEPRPAAKRHARERLRRAMEEEAGRRTARRARRRWVVGGLAAVLVVGITPAGLDGQTAPLVGLADAVAAAPVATGTAERHWYARTESRELVSVTVALDEPRVLEFLIPAVEERWHDAGDAPRRTITYGQPTFFSPEDEDAFHAAGLGATYGAGHQVSSAMAPADYSFASSLPDASPEILEGQLRRRIAGVGDRRLEEVRLLQLTAELMHLHADDPDMRAKILRVIADIPGIVVVPNAHSVVVSIDYLDGDRPLRLMYVFDADSAHLVGEYLAALATQSEPATVLRSARHSGPLPAGFSES